MASIYARARSPYWWAKLRDPVTLEWVARKTPYKQDDPAGKRRALMWASALDKVGRENRSVAQEETWGAWVCTWLKQHYGYNPKTLKRYENAWAPLFEFLVEKKVVCPRQLQYKHASLYLHWRTQQKRRCGKPINHNTAVTELKVMSRILGEAKQRGFTDNNPFYQLGLKRVGVKHTPDMTRDEIAICREALVKENAPVWMIRSFEIALHQGVRLTETQVAMENVFLDSRTANGNKDRITFHMKGKNGKPKIHTVPLHPALRPMMLEIQKAGEKFTCELPAMAAKEWWAFRQRNSLSHLRFHSTRATLATELARNGVSMQKAMEILAHATETVHRVYLNLSAKDVADELGKVSFATPDKP